MRFGETSCRSAMSMSYPWTLAQAAQGANDTQVTDSEPHAANMLDSLVTLARAGIAAGVAFVGIPVVVGAAGFTGAGIAAGTLAAKMMSAAAVANGGGVATGSTVAVLQSIGAAGLPAAAKTVIIGVGAAVGALL
nr:interferon alpha-inducible protein 27-like protein 2 [Chelonoidis abingdonii]